MISKKNVRVWLKVTLEVAGPFERSEVGNRYVLILSDFQSNWIEMVPVIEVSITNLSKFILENFLRYGVCSCELKGIEESNRLALVSEVEERWKAIVGSSQWSSSWCSILRKCFESEEKAEKLMVVYDNSQRITNFIIGRSTNTWDKDLDLLLFELRTKDKCFSTMYGRDFVSPYLLTSEKTASYRTGCPLETKSNVTNSVSQVDTNGLARYSLRTILKAKGTSDLVSEVHSKSLQKRLAAIVQDCASVAQTVEISAEEAEQDILDRRDVVVSRSNEVEEAVIDLIAETNAKRSKPQSLLPFKCPWCVCTFLATQQDLDVHLKCHEGNRRNLTCPVCKQHCKTWVRMERHLVSHPEMASQFSQMATERRTCAECKKVFSHRETMLRHLDVVHRNVLRFRCETCGATFKEKKTYDRHLDVHADVTHRCDKCNYKTKISNNLKIHQKIHTGQGFACSVCRRVFTKQSILKIHKNVHRKSCETFQCEICNAQLKCSLTLKQHIRNMHEVGDPFPCNRCSYVGKNKANLTNHLERKHNKPFGCSHCDYCCRSDSALKRHIDVFHEGHRPFSCEHCPYRARDAKQLAGHVKFKHKPGALRFSCDLCDRRFKTMTMLRHHMPVHTGQHLYSCKLCSYTAKYRQTLHQHVRKKHPGNFVSEAVESTSASDVIETVTEEVNENENAKVQEVDPNHELSRGIILNTESGAISLPSNVQFHVVDCDQQLQLLSDAVSLDSSVQVLFLSIDTELEMTDGQQQ